MSGKNILIEKIHSKFTAIYIAKYFADNRIAEISRITLLPILDSGRRTSYNTAYITVNRWLSASSGLCFALTFGSKLGDFQNILRVQSNEEWVIIENKYNYYTHDMPGYTSNFNVVDPHYYGENYDIEAQKAQFVDLV
jgi:hypothetical protein